MFESNSLTINEWAQILPENRRKCSVSRALQGPYGLGYKQRARLNVWQPKDFRVVHGHQIQAKRPRRNAASAAIPRRQDLRSEEHTSELQSRGHLVCRLLLEKRSHRHTDGHHDKPGG